MFHSESFEKIKYGSKSTHLDDSINRLLNSMEWRNSELILDYGCGPGVITKNYLSPKAQSFNSTVHCVDISEVMIQRAMEVNSGNPNVECFLGNIMSENWMLKEKKYDKIFAIYVCNWFSDARKVLERFHEGLNPGGYLGLKVMSSGSYHHQLMVAIATDPKWGKYMEDYEKYDYWSMYDDPDQVLNYYKQSFLSIGYEIIDCAHYDAIMSPITLWDLTGFYMGFNPFLSNIPQDLMKEFQEDNQKYLKHLMKLEKADGHELIPYPPCTYLSAVVKRI